MSGKRTLVMGGPASPLLEPLASLGSLHVTWTLVHCLGSQLQVPCFVPTARPSYLGTRSTANTGC